MKKIAVVALIALSLQRLAFAGDVAVFVEGGFSSDGNYYVFGEYGRADKTFRGWADIRVVDARRNVFVTGETFKTAPSPATDGKTGREVYDSLAAKSWGAIKKYSCEKPSADQTLYICGDALKKGADKIEFKDFTAVLGSRADCSVVLSQSVVGSGPSARSSFFITLERRDESGNILSSQKIGSPDIWREGVTGYKIEKICCDKRGENIVFVVEKTAEDETGVLARYMVESARVER